ncbi:serine hydrolase domain-containing protein [Roseivirga sp.]|uniref:serine hydrolase domain-containing protein n=1 Tax=Roseivirga sp. TaxID=1964215 RepID=UPI003B52E8AA
MKKIQFGRRVHIPSMVLLILSLTQSSIYGQGNSRNLVPKATGTEGTLSFSDIPYLKESFIDVSPMDGKDGIWVGELGVDGGKKEMIVELAQEIADGQHGNFDSFLILHKDKLVFESYYLRGRIDLPHPQASATKAYTSLILGRAIQLGYLTMEDLDKPLISFLKDLDLTKLVDGAERITLHDALTMRSGMRLTSQQKEEFEKNPNQLKGQGLVQTYLENTEPITSASQSFKYQDDPILIMQVIDAVVPGSAEEFIKEELLDKLGITRYNWQLNVSGVPEAGWLTSMTSRDMAKWGLLTTNKGKWNGEQLVPEAFIDKAVNRIVLQADDENFSDYGSVSNIGYGYYWWQADLKANNRSYFSTSAQGGSGQYIVLIDELDLIVVTTVHHLEISVLQLVAERVIPAFAN